MHNNKSGTRQQTLSFLLLDYLGHTWDANYIVQTPQYIYINMCVLSMYIGN